MLFVDRVIIENARRVLIQLLNLFDDALGIQRTILSKEERHKLRKLNQEDSPDKNLNL